MTSAFAVSLLLPSRGLASVCACPRSPQVARKAITKPSGIPKMMQRQAPPQTSSAPSSLSLATFKAFFSAMPGSWNSQRTYHYLTPGEPQEREESQTTFDVERLTPSQIKDVLASNSDDLASLTGAEGFRVSFLTRMASQDELVRSGTNLAFVPENGRAGTVEGSYYRDLGYEESRPIKARFVFDVERNELQMTTFYTKVISVDEIRLVNNEVRLRRILNYRRPQQDGDPLTDPLLIGYGVECKGDSGRLVE